MCTIKELHRAMKNKVIDGVNREKGRKALAAKVGCSESLIHGILDEREFPSKKAFELWFGPLNLDVDSDNIEDVPMAGLKVDPEPVAKPENDIPFVIDCPDFDNLKRMMSELGYATKIVKD